MKRPAEKGPPHSLQENPKTEPQLRKKCPDVYPATGAYSHHIPSCDTRNPHTIDTASGYTALLSKRTSSNHHNNRPHDKPQANYTTRHPSTTRAPNCFLPKFRSPLHRDCTVLAPACRNSGTSSRPHCFPAQSPSPSSWAARTWRPPAGASGCSGTRRPPPPSRAACRGTAPPAVSRTNPRRPCRRK